MPRSITTIPIMPKLEQKKKVAAYARVSSGKDAMLQSLSAQVSYYSNLIQSRNDWLYVGIYADEAVTGTKGGREDFQRLISDCHTGKVDMVITKSISRFARNTVTLLESVRDLKALGVDVYFEEQNIHTLSGEGELMLSILASYAQEESRSVSENCKWRIRKGFQNGELVNMRFLYGYRITKSGIEVDEEQAKIVRMIFNDYLGGMGGYAIAKKLMDMGVPTYTGSTWSPKRVLDIIKNEKYSGNSLLQKSYVVDHLGKAQVHNKGHLPMYFAEGTHAALIDDASFMQAQEIMAARRERNKPQNRNTNRYPFSGVIKCPKCGKYYRRKTTHGKVTWNCSSYLQHGKKVCYGKQIPESVLYELSMEVLDMPVFNADIFSRQIKEILVPEDNRLRFVFNNGEEVEKTWLDRSRSESWTPEMKEQARQRTLSYRGGAQCQE